MPHFVRLRPALASFLFLFFFSELDLHCSSCWVQSKTVLKTNRAKKPRHHFGTTPNLRQFVNVRNNISQFVLGASYFRTSVPLLKLNVAEPLDLTLRKLNRS